MSKEYLYPSEHAEDIIIRAMKNAEDYFNTAISKEEGHMTRMVLLSEYSANLLRLSTALKQISTECHY